MIKTTALDSPSQFKEELFEDLYERAGMVLHEMGVEAASDDEDDVEIFFDDKDLPLVKKIAEMSMVSYYESDRTIEITEDDPIKLEQFFNALDSAGIEYDGGEGDDETDGSGDTVYTEDLDEDLDEASKLRKHTKASDKLKHQRSYRKNKSRIKIKQKRYRKTSKFKRLKRIGKIRKKSGRTATGRRMIKRI